MKFRIHFGSILKHFRRPNPLKSILKFPKVRFCKRRSVRVSESPFLLHALGGITRHVSLTPAIQKSLIANIFAVVYDFILLGKSFERGTWTQWIQCLPKSQEH